MSTPGRVFAHADLESTHMYDAWDESAGGRPMAQTEGRLLADLLRTSVGRRFRPGRRLRHRALHALARDRGLRAVGLDAWAAMLAMAAGRGGGPHMHVGPCLRVTRISSMI